MRMEIVVTSAGANDATRPERCICGGEVDAAQNWEGSPIPGVRCLECGYQWEPGFGVSFEHGYHAWVTYLADLCDDLGPLQGILDEVEAIGQRDDERRRRLGLEEP
jgi:hypothetical protein